MYKIRKKWTKISNFWTDFWKKWSPHPNSTMEFQKQFSLPSLTREGQGESLLHVNSPFTVHRRQNSIKYKSTENTNNNQQIKTLSNQPPPHKPILLTAKGDFKAPNSPSKPHKKHSKIYRNELNLSKYNLLFIICSHLSCHCVFFPLITCFGYIHIFIIPLLWMLLPSLESTFKMIV